MITIATSTRSKRPNLWPGVRAGFAPCIIGGAGTRIPDLSAFRFDFAVTGTGTAYVGIGSPIGQAVDYIGNVGHQQAGSASYTLPCKFMTNTVSDELTIAAVFRFDHSAIAKESTLFWSDNPTLGSLQYGYRLYVDNNTDQLKLAIYNGDDIVTTFPTYYPSNSTLTTGRWYVAVVSWDGQGRDGVGVDLCSMWIDGIDEGYLTITKSVPSGVEEFCSHLGTQNSRVGTTLNSVLPDHSVALVVVWNRKLSLREIDQISADPVGMFRHRGYGVGGKGPRIISIGGSVSRDLNVKLAG